MYMYNKSGRIIQHIVELLSGIEQSPSDPRMAAGGRRYTLQEVNNLHSNTGTYLHR